MVFPQSQVHSGNSACNLTGIWVSRKYDQLKLWWGYPGLGWALNPTDWCHYQDEDRCSGKTAAGWQWRQAGGADAWPREPVGAATGARGSSGPGPESQEGWPCQHLHRAPGLQTCDRMRFYQLTTSCGLVQQAQEAVPGGSGHFLNVEMRQRLSELFLGQNYTDKIIVLIQILAVRLNTMQWNKIKEYYSKNKTKNWPDGALL